MIESRCGILCNECDYKEEITCHVGGTLSVKLLQKLLKWSKIVNVYAGLKSRIRLTVLYMEE
jgi:hypothetical protein